MDKFGVFNLLNSFLKMNKQSAGDAKSETNTNSTLSNLLSALSNGISGSPPKTQPTTPQKQILNSATPLQSSMLNTMTSHDEFVKRVNEKNKK